MVVDSLTKFTFARPLRDATTAHTIAFLKQDILFKMFVPEIIISDNGPQFRSDVFKTFMSTMKIKHWRTAVYHPQANASECANKSIVNGIRAFIEGRHNHAGWSNYFNEIICAVNTSTHTATNVTPYFAMFGREMVLDA